MSANHDDNAPLKTPERWIWVLLIGALIIVAAVGYSAYQQYQAGQRGVTEFICRNYPRYSTEWQNCIDDH